MFLMRNKYESTDRLDSPDSSSLVVPTPFAIWLWSSFLWTGGVYFLVLWIYDMFQSTEGYRMLLYKLRVPAMIITCISIYSLLISYLCHSNLPGLARWRMIDKGPVATLALAAIEWPDGWVIPYETEESRSWAQPNSATNFQTRDLKQFLLS